MNKLRVLKKSLIQAFKNKILKLVNKLFIEQT